MKTSSNSWSVGCGSGYLILLISIIVRAILDYMLFVFLWNWLMPDLFGFSKISPLQSMEVFFLIGLLRLFLFSNNSSSD